MASPDIEKDPSCMDDFDPNSIRVEDAIHHIQRSITPVTDTVSVPVRDALWRVLARDVTAAIDVPNHNNSAMDGYAVRFADLSDTGVVELTVQGVSFAGQPFDGALAATACVRIMTGAIIPPGADMVVMQEDVEVAGDTIRVGQGHKPGQFVRLAGDDVAANSIVLQQGKRISPADVGLLATCGVGEVPVVRPLRIAFMSTGDELRAIGEPLNAGDVYDSNRYSLHAMLTRLGVDVLDLGVIADEPRAVRDAFTRAAAMADAVIVSGGASVGDADFVHATLKELGEVNFWKIAMKPGRPLAYGRIGDALFFGLPGNPVSVIVTFYQFVTPALKRLMGMHQTLPLRLPVTLDNAIKKSPGRTEFQRGILFSDDDGQLKVRTTGAQGSHILTSMSQANCFIVLPLEAGDIAPGAHVLVEPFDGVV